MIEVASVPIIEEQVDAADYPDPVGWRVLIEPIKIEDVSAGGIALPTQAVQAKEHLRYIGKVVKMGHLCYQHQKFRDADGTSLKWCNVGDYVAYGAYAGQEISVRNKKRDGLVKLRLINDDEILSVITDPSSVHIYC